MGGFDQLWQSTGLSNFQVGQAVMMGVGFLLIYLAIKKGFEPLLLLPIGFGAVLSNIPMAGIAEEGDYCPISITASRSACFHC